MCSTSPARPGGIGTEPGRHPGGSPLGHPGNPGRRGREPRRLAVRPPVSERRPWSARTQGSTMTDQQPAPLQPPTAAATLTLTAPPPPQPVAATSAPRMAPAVEAAALPGLDAKVDAYLELADGRRAPLAGVRGQGRRRAHHGRRRHPRGGRDVEPPAQDRRSRRCRRAASSEGSKVGSTLLELRRTVEDLDPKERDRRQEVPRHDAVRRQGHRLLPQVPVGAEPPRRDPARPARRPGRAGARTTPRSTMEKQHLWDAMGRLNQYVYVAERLDARLAAAHRRPRGDRPRARPRRCATTCSSTSARSTRTC